MTKFLVVNLDLYRLEDEILLGWGLIDKESWIFTFLSSTKSFQGLGGGRIVCLLLKYVPSHVNLSENFPTSLPTVTWRELKNQRSSMVIYTLGFQSVTDDDSQGWWHRWYRRSVVTEGSYSTTWWYLKYWQFKMGIDVDVFLPETEWRLKV